MKKISVEKLEDTHDCEYCGLDHREGYIISVDGVVVVDKAPVAHCFDSTEYEISGFWYDIADILRNHDAEQFPADLAIEDAIGEEPEYNDQDPTEWNAFSARRENYPLLIQDFLNKQGIFLEVLDAVFQDRHDHWPEEDDSA